MALVLALMVMYELVTLLSPLRPTAVSVLPAVSVLAGVATAAVDLAWYPPAQSAITNLSSALNGSGVYGFVYSSSNSSAGPGEHNWCNMPHLRPSDYVVAPAAFRLKYVEVIQRHHKRTPYAANAFPVEPYRWDCDGQGLYHFGQRLPAGQQSAQTYWDQEQEASWSVGPLAPPCGWVGTCSFPQITADGLDDSWTHGRDLYAVYHDALAFLPSREQDWRRKVRFRVTRNQITSQVAGQLVAGMWNTTSSVPLLVQADGVDSLEPTYRCDVGRDLFDRIRSGSDDAAWPRHLAEAAPLYARLDAVSGVPPQDVAFHASFDHYYDNLSARQCHGKSLPCRRADDDDDDDDDGVNGTACVTQEQADAVYRLGHWEYSHIYRGARDSLAASASSYGVWVAELAAHLRAVMAGETETVYFHHVAHDGSLSRLLSILQYDGMAWPGMGSELVFELYQKKSEGADADAGDGSGSGHHIRVLFGGQPLRSSNPSLGLMHMLPVETLLAYLDGLVGVNAGLVLGKCNGTIPI